MTATLGFTVIGLLQAVILGLLLYTINRVNALGDQVADLRVDVARLAQRLEDHISDPHAHS